MFHCTSGINRHQYSFYELVHNTDRLDLELLQGFLLQHESGLHVLDSPEVIDNFPILRLRPSNTRWPFWPRTTSSCSSTVRQG